MPEMGERRPEQTRGALQRTHAIGLAALGLAAMAVIAGCGGAANPAGGTTPTPSATSAPYAGWTSVPKFALGNERFTLSLKMPPSWTYVPATNSGTGCSTSVCYVGQGDELQGPGGAGLTMGGPTGQPTTCTDYARAQTGAGYAQTGQKPIVVSGIHTTEYTFTQQAGAARFLYIVPLDSGIGCAAIIGNSGQPPVDQQTFDRIVASIRMNPTI